MKEQTWTNDRMWLMDGKIVVRNGGNLTIEAGTIVKAKTENGADATVLVIAKGGKINAVGTAKTLSFLLMLMMILIMKTMELARIVSLQIWANGVL